MTSSARRVAQILRNESSADDSSTPRTRRRKRLDSRTGTVTIEEWLDRPYCSANDCDEPVVCCAGKYGDDDPLCYVHLAAAAGGE